MPQKRPYCELDTECTHNWWLAKFYAPDGKMYSFELVEGSGVPLNIAGIQWFIDNFTLVTFNGDGYDIPMLSLAMTGVGPARLKYANDCIILRGLRRWDFYRSFGINEPRNLDHIDIMEPTPGVRVGLKTYMGRMHSKTIQDLPFDPDARLNAQERYEADIYCGNDLSGTRELRETIKDRLELREEIGEEYGVDLRSKSDAQMSEACIKARLGFVPEKRIIPHGFTFQYEPAPFIRFTTPQLQEVFQTVCNAKFVVNDVDQLRSHEGEEIIGEDGKKLKTGVVIPPELKGLVVKIGNTKYKFGIGGLHSQEEKVNFHTQMGRHTVRMDDVKSYYPSLILLLGMYPMQLGPQFIEIYGHEYIDRLDAKVKAEDKSLDAPTRKRYKTKTSGKKILLNGAFGKLFSKYSIMFAPEQGIRVTITGQLAMFMLIESLELCGVSVISANTDSIVTLCPVGREWIRDQCIRDWEKRTGLEMEDKYVKSLYAQSVNSYIAFTMDGAHVAKGMFAESGVLAGMSGANPEKDICVDAVIEYLRSGKRLEQTIGECQDIRRFISIRAVKGGGVYYPKSLGMDEKVINADGAVYLGKVVRFYYAKGVDECIHYKDRNPTKKEIAAYIADGTPVPFGGRGNKVAGSDGAQPCMRLPDRFPDNVDHARYVSEAIKMLSNLGLEYAV